MTEPDAHPPRQLLIAEANKIATKLRVLARRNYFAAYICTGIATVFSVGASFAVAFDFHSKSLQALVTLVPAAALFISATMNFEAKSRWYWKKRRKVEVIIRALQYENLDVPTGSRQLSELNSAMEESYPGFGAIPGPKT